MVVNKDNFKLIDDSLDQIPNKENGVNPRNGFPK